MDNLILRSLVAVLLFVLVANDQTFSQTKNEDDMIYKEMNEGQTVIGPSGEVLDFDNFIGTAGDTNSEYEFTLYQNYPDPFNEMTLIEFSLPAKNYTKLFIADEKGAEIEVLVDGNVESGHHFVFYKPSPKIKDGIYNCRMFVHSEDKSELLNEQEIKIRYSNDKSVVLKK